MSGTPVALLQQFVSLAFIQCFYSEVSIKVAQYVALPLALNVARGDA